MDVLLRRSARVVTVDGSVFKRVGEDVAKAFRY
jgi:hypothetical protein